MDAPGGNTATPTSEMGAPTSEMGAPTSEMGTPTSDLDTPTSEMDTPTSEMDTPTSEMDTPTSGMEIPVRTRVPAGGTARAIDLRSGETCFVTSLRQDRDALDEIHQHNTTEVQQGTEDTSTISTQLTLISKEVDILDPIMANKYETNPDKLHAWQRASRVERDPKRGKKPDGSGGTPPTPPAPAK